MMLIKKAMTKLISQNESVGIIFSSLVIMAFLLHDFEIKKKVSVLKKYLNCIPIYGR